MRREKVIRLIYSMVAFTGSVMLRNIDHGYLVYAQEQPQAQYERHDWEDRHDRKEKEIDDHLRTTDSEVVEQGKKIAMISGVGATIGAGLGILNLLGFLKPQGSKEERHGKTHFITPEGDK